MKKFKNLKIKSLESEAVDDFVILYDILYHSCIDTYKEITADGKHAFFNSFSDIKWNSIERPRKVNHRGYGKIDAFGYDTCLYGTGTNKATNRLEILFINMSFPIDSNGDLNCTPVISSFGLLCK